MISKQTGTRELITLEGNGVLIHGTFHKTPDHEYAASRKKVGVMFLAALANPRSLTGDSGVYWADSFAANGYPSFRFDLAGLGDSCGETPNALLKFINEGGWAAQASSKLKELVATRDLSGVVVFGHCAGAVTAIYAASECKDCKGLILMDPSFSLSRALSSTLSPGVLLWARRSKTGGAARAMYDRVRELQGVFRKKKLPTNANVNLISRLKQVMANGLPILVLQAPQPATSADTKLQGVTFDYLAYIASLAVRSDQFTVERIEDTDHSFSNRAGRAGVRQQSEEWLAKHFPVPITEAEPFETAKSLLGRVNTTYI